MLFLASNYAEIWHWYVFKLLAMQKYNVDVACCIQATGYITFHYFIYTHIQSILTKHTAIKTIKISMKIKSSLMNVGIVFDL